MADEKTGKKPDDQGGGGAEKGADAGEAGGRARQLLYTCFNDGAGNYIDPSWKMVHVLALRRVELHLSESGIAEEQGSIPCASWPGLDRSESEREARRGRNYGWRKHRQKT